MCIRICISAENIFPQLHIKVDSQWSEFAEQILLLPEDEVRKMRGLTKPY